MGARGQALRAAGRPKHTIAAGQACQTKHPLLRPLQLRQPAGLSVSPQSSVAAGLRMAVAVVRQLPLLGGKRQWQRPEQGQLQSCGFCYGCRRHLHLCRRALGLQQVLQSGQRQAVRGPCAAILCWDLSDRKGDCSRLLPQPLLLPQDRRCWLPRASRGCGAMAPRWSKRHSKLVTAPGSHPLASPLPLDPDGLQAKMQVREAEAAQVWLAWAR